MTSSFTDGTTTPDVVKLALVGVVDTAKLTISKPALGTHTISPRTAARAPSGIDVYSIDRRAAQN